MTERGDASENGSAAAPGEHLVVQHPLVESLPHRASTGIGSVIDDLGRLDRAVYAAIAETPTPQLDATMRRLTTAANHSKIWLATAGVLAVAGGSVGRRAARSGVASIGAASFVVNVVIKPFARRPRPDRDAEDVPDEREVPMPRSTSFPSGHSASAFAFATGVGHELPIAGAVLRLAAGWVAYSRVHTGVHYPTDVVVGSILGAAIAEVSAPLRERIDTRLAGVLD